MHKLSLSIVLTSQGIAFLHAGTEFLRSKKGVENSFESPDSINAIDWNLKSKNKDVFDYVKALITMRKEHPAFRMTDAKQIAQNIRFSKDLPGNIVAYTINGSRVNDRWKKIHVAFNGNAAVRKISLAPGVWKVFIKNNALTGTIEYIENSISLAPYSCTILYQ